MGIAMFLLTSRANRRPSRTTFYSSFRSADSSITSRAMASRAQVRDGRHRGVLISFYYSNKARVCWSFRFLDASRR